MFLSSIALAVTMNNPALPIWTISNNDDSKLIYEIQFFADLLFHNPIGEPIRSDSHNSYFVILDDTIETMPPDGVTGYRDLRYDASKGVHPVNIGKDGAQVAFLIDDLRNDFEDVYNEAVAYRVKANEGYEYGYLYLTP